MKYSTFVRSLVRKNPDLKLKLKQANSKLTPFQFIHQSIFMTGFTYVAVLVVMYMVLFRINPMFFLIGIVGSVTLIPVIFRFWKSTVNALIAKEKRKLDADLMFAAEYLLVSLQSGLPIGNIIERFSHNKRPSAQFFRRIYDDFRTGKDLQRAVEDAISYCPSKDFKVLLKRIADSLSIGVNLDKVLSNFIKEASQQKLLNIKAFAKKMNPMIMMYLVIGVVAPSLGTTFFIVGAVLFDITPSFLQIILVAIWMMMFVFQYMAYSIFRFSREAV